MKYFARGRSPLNVSFGRRVSIRTRESRSGEKWVSRARDDCTIADYFMGYCIVTELIYEQYKG